MKRLIFTVYVDIPEDKLDNPANWNNETGKQNQTDKSRNTKEKFAIYKDRLIAKQQTYAEICKADYRVYDDSDHFDQYQKWFDRFVPEISMYDRVNFYKHHVMFQASHEYDQVCYFDLDVIPLTDQSVFDSFDMGKFHVGESNDASMWGRTVKVKFYNACIRNPASKFFNAQALAYYYDIEPLNDVFNTGIMFAGKEVIQKLNYFDQFEELLATMKELKTDPNSMYPFNIQRSFGYDNETVFAHRINIQNVPYETLPIEWNTTNLSDKALEKAKLVHVISKNFHLII